MSYVELHCHSNFSFQEGASSIQELLNRAVNLGYEALAITDHNNLCVAMEFAREARALDIQPITGAEITLEGGHHATILVKSLEGYSNLCQIISNAKLNADSKRPYVHSRLLSERSEGLIFLTGCNSGEVAKLIRQGKFRESEEVAKRYIEWFGHQNVYIELQQNLVHGDTKRNSSLISLAKRVGLEVVATNNVHYHVSDRHKLHDCLVSIKHRKTLENSHQERKANSEFYLKSHEEMKKLFKDIPEAISNTAKIAKKCEPFDLSTDLKYTFPVAEIPEGFTQESYLRHLCIEAATRKYGCITNRVKARLEKEFRLIKRHKLFGFFLIYYDVIQIAREVQIDIGLTDLETPLEANPPGRGRGSSVAMLIGYLIGLSHIDPLQFDLSLERFLPDDGMVSVPDIDLDFPRNIRDKLIARIHDKYGYDKAALIGMFSTYKLKSGFRDLGFVFGLSGIQIDRLINFIDRDDLGKFELQREYADRVKFFMDAKRWSDFINLFNELDGFPRYLAQHPSGMVISSEPLTEIVPVQPSAIDGRYVMDWDKNSIQDANMVKIDFLSLGALSQIQDIESLIELRTGHRVDLSRIDFDDMNVYRMLWRADTIGVFQVESAAQMQVITRLKPMNLYDMAREVAAVRPGVGANDSVNEYIARRNSLKQISFVHELEKRSLNKTLGVILFQDQINQLAIDVAGFSPLEADQLRRAYGRRNAKQLIPIYWDKFKYGAIKRGVSEKQAFDIFKKFNGHYMFPESHAFAFGVTAYQISWLKYYYPLEFYIGLFNQQPMGFYNLETLKEDAKRHGIKFLNPDINKSNVLALIEGECIRLGFKHVDSIGEVLAEKIVKSRTASDFISIREFMERTGLAEESIVNLANAGAFDSIKSDRRAVIWEIGLRYHSANEQMTMDLPVLQDIIKLGRMTPWEEMVGEYRTMGVHPKGHIMEHIWPKLSDDVVKSEYLQEFRHGANVNVAGLIIRKQRPLGKAVFITLEDHTGHVPLILWPAIYKKFRHELNSSIVQVRGVVSRRAGTMNIVVVEVRKLLVSKYLPKGKSWG